MKKLLSAILAIFTLFLMTACEITIEEPTEESSEPTASVRDRDSRDEAVVDVNVPITSEDFAKEHGIELDIEYYFYNNPSQGTLSFSEGGILNYDIPGVDMTQTTWSADVNGVYIANYEGTEHQVTLYEDGKIFEMGDNIVVVKSGTQSTGYYIGMYKYEGDHDWLDILEIYDDYNASYINLDENGTEIEQGGATILSYDNNLVITTNFFDQSYEPVFLTTDNGGYTFNDGWYSYEPYQPEESDASGSEFIDWSEYVAAWGDRTEYRDLAAEQGIEIDLVYYSDRDDGTYIFISEDGLLYVFNTASTQTVPFPFEIDGSVITVLDSNFEYVSELIFNGSSFYETDSGIFYEP
jgi:hypothetical protein